MGRILLVILMLIFCDVADNTAVAAGSTKKAADTAVPESVETEELATYMVQLQRYTHKLSLSAEANNRALSAFYLHESLALLEEIQHKLPVYEDQPVALYIDRFALPRYQPLQTLLSRSATGASVTDELVPAVQTVIDGCNRCHVASSFPFIKIRHSTENPFNQDFQL